MYQTLAARVTCHQQKVKPACCGSALQPRKSPSEPTMEASAVLGVGYSIDSVVASVTNIYECVYPTGTARFGRAPMPEDFLKLKHAAMVDNFWPIDPNGASHLRRFVKTYSDLMYMMRLSNDLHTLIVEGQFLECLRCSEIIFSKG